MRAVPEVGAAVGDITDQQVKLAGRDGKPVGDGPYFGVGYDAGAKGAGGLTPFQLRQGRFARGADEVVVDAGTAEKQGWKVGDAVKVSGRGPARRMRISGIARFGDVDSLGTATSAVMDLGAAQSLLGREDRFDNVLVAAAPGRVRGRAAACARRASCRPRCACRARPPATGSGSTSCHRWSSGSR